MSNPNNILSGQSGKYIPDWHVADCWLVMTPTGHLWYYRAAGADNVCVYSHLAGCGGVDPGRHCAGSPCLSHCSLSTHESPLDCPKPVILPLYTHTHTHWSYTQINIDCTSTHIHSQVHQAVPANIQHNTKCKHWTRQTHVPTDTLPVTHPHTGKQQDRPKITPKITTNNRRHDRKTHKNTHKHSELFNPKYLLHRPHMQQNQRNSGTWHQYNIRGKSLQKVTVWMMS